MSERNDIYDPYRCSDDHRGEMCVFWGRGSEREVCNGSYCRPRAPQVEAAIQTAREKLLACSMVLAIPTDATTRLVMVMRLVEEAADVLAGRKS